MRIIILIFLLLFPKLLACASVADYIDLKEKKIIRRVDANRNVLSTEVKESIEVPSFSVYGYKHIYVNDEKIDDSLIEMTYSI